MTRSLGGLRVLVAMCILGITGGVGTAAAQGTCSSMPTAAELRTALQQAVTHGGEAGGLFHGSRMWGSIVNRSGAICVTAASNTDPTQVWPGSQAIAKAKAYTANAFSLDALALSSAMLYTFTQPGHSLWSLGQSNLFDSDFLSSPENTNAGQGQIAGGLIFFGGGVPLYRNGRIIGGLGISGDTSCADHEIAKRVRDILAMNPPGGMLADDIVYDESVFNHPLCVNTYKNGVFIGNEKPAKY
jgi:uncharacterized protein GlcG (DUF336 family)